MFVGLYYFKKMWMKRQKEEENDTFRIHIYKHLGRCIIHLKTRQNGLAVVTQLCGKEMNADCIRYCYLSDTWKSFHVPTLITLYKV